MKDKKYLDDFYKTDQSLNRCAPKLTNAHPNLFQKMKVSYAFQVFSATVAGIHSVLNIVNYLLLQRLLLISLITWTNYVIY